MNSRSTLALLTVLSLVPAAACGEGDSETTAGDTATTAADTSDSAGDAATDSSSDSSSDTGTDGTADTGDTGSTDGTGDTGGSSGHAGSCDFRPAELQCWHAVNEFDEPAAIQTACENGGGVYSSGDCDTADLAAICDQTPYKIFYYYNGVDMTLAELACSQIGGVWMPQ
jgi:hypothetical protein